LQKPQIPGQEGQEDQYGLALTENDMMVLEGKDMPVDMHDDHIVHVALHQEAFGKGADELVGKHIGLHQMYMEQGEGTTSEKPNIASIGGVPEGIAPQDLAAFQATQPSGAVPGAPSVPQANVGQAAQMGQTQTPGI
jgi:hypothetical protein